MPSGSRPGERRGGRSKGTPNKSTIGAAAVPAYTPVPVQPAQLRALDEMRLGCMILRNLMIQAANDMKKMEAPTAAAIHFLADRVKDYLRAQREVAPYEDPKLVSVKVGGDEKNPMLMMHKYDFSNLTEEQLAALVPMLRLLTPMADKDQDSQSRAH